MNFKPSPPGTRPALSQFLPRRSLYVMTGNVKDSYTHGFDNTLEDQVDGKLRRRNATRVSFTFRSFKNVPASMMAFVGRPAAKSAPAHSLRIVEDDVGLAAAIAASKAEASVVDLCSDSVVVAGRARGGGGLDHRQREVIDLLDDGVDPVEGGHMTRVLPGARKTAICLVGSGGRASGSNVSTVVIIDDEVSEAGQSSATGRSTSAQALPEATAARAAQSKGSGDQVSSGSKRRRAGQSVVEDFVVVLE